MNECQSSEGGETFNKTNNNLLKTYHLLLGSRAWFRARQILHTQGIASCGLCT